MKQFKAILVGNGTMGKRHRERFEACGVRFEQVVDVNDSVSGFDVDFAVIASPASTHYAYAKMFLERHVPVFIEKPLAVSAEESQELVDLSLKNQTVMFVAQSECYNPIFLNFRKHFLTELNRRLASPNPLDVHLEFRREHRYSLRCRDVNVSLDLLVHDLSLFLTMFRLQDLKVSSFKAIGESENFDKAQLRLEVERGAYRGVVADFLVNRSSDCDERSITVDFKRDGDSPVSSYTVSLARYRQDGEIEHVPDSLENEHKFFLKLLAGACIDLGRRAVQHAADCVKLAALR